jgi:hypothetical protein
VRQRRAQKGGGELESAGVAAHVMSAVKETRAGGGGAVENYCWDAEEGLATASGGGRLQWVAGQWAERGVMVQHDMSARDGQPAERDATGASRREGARRESSVVGSVRERVRTSRGTTFPNASVRAERQSVRDYCVRLWTRTEQTQCTMVFLLQAAALHYIHNSHNGHKRLVGPDIHKKMRRVAAAVGANT